MELTFTPQTIQIKYIRIIIPLIGDEELPANFCKIIGPNLDMKINVDTGQILNWNIGETANIHIKADSRGEYYLLNEDFQEIFFIIEGSTHIPDKFLPEGSTHYLNLNIDEKGYVTNWRKEKSLKGFVTDECLKLLNWK